MKRRTRLTTRPHALTLWETAGFSLALLTFAGAGADAQTIILSDNITNVSAGTVAAAGDTWLASSFGTGPSAAALDTVTLLLENSVPGAAEVDIYSDATDIFGDDGYAPDTLVGTLTSPTAYSTTGLADTTFTATGISLAADTTYWVVLHAATGEFDWSNTTDDSGNGTGFQDAYAENDDASAPGDWTTYDSAPTQMTVTALAAAPESSSAQTLGLGALLLAAALLWRRRLKTPDADAMDARLMPSDHD